jgi:hypothetical protein
LSLRLIDGHVVLCPLCGWMKKSHVHAYVCACVQDTTLFFLASHPNPRCCANLPLTQPFRATNQRAVVAGHQQV